MDFFRIRRISGEAVHHGSYQIEPQAFVLQFRWPYGGMVWEQPLAVKVTDRTGFSRSLPVIDVTRLLQLLAFGLVVLSTILLRRKP